jgi:hypothetical protein
MSGGPRLTLTPATFAPAVAGGPLVAAITVRNGAGVVDEIALHLEGLDPSWYQLEPQRFNLFPDAEGVATLTLSIPEGVPAGTFPFRLVAVSRQAPDAPVTAEASLAVAAVSQLGLMLVPPRRRATGEASFVARLRNDGNDVVALHLDATDPDEALRFAIRPADLTLAPGETASVDVRARLRRRRLTGRDRSHPFAVGAYDATPGQIDGAEPLTTAPGEIVQAPLWPFLSVISLSLRQAAMLGLLLLLPLAVLGWVLGNPGMSLPGRPRPGTPEAALQLTPGGPGGAGTLTGTPAAGTAGGVGGAGAGGTGTTGGVGGVPPLSTPPMIARFGLNLADEGSLGDLPLIWNVQDATQISLRRQDGGGPVQLRFDSIERAEFLLTATNATGSVSQPLTLYILRPPEIERFDADGAAAGGDSAVRLMWLAQRADRVYLDGVLLDDATLTEALLPGVPREVILRVENAAGEATRRILLVPPALPTPPAAGS